MTTKTKPTKSAAAKTRKPAKSDTSIDLTENGEDPFGRAMQTWFDRWADSFGMRLPDVFGNRLPELWGAGREMGGVIRIEEIADDDGITIRGELPGIDPDEDVEITVDNGRLNISAERRQREETTEDGRCRTEFRYGSYRRSLTLPAGTDTSEITATYNDGILEVRIPIDGAEAEAARIPVQSGS